MQHSMARTLAPDSEPRRSRGPRRGQDYASCAIDAGAARVGGVRCVICFQRGWQGIALNREMASRLPNQKALTSS
jgi:hypothetical protein